MSRQNEIIALGPNSMWRVPYKRRKALGRQREDSRVKAQAEPGALLPRAKRHLGLLGAGRGRKEPSMHGPANALISRFQTSHLQNRWHNKFTLFEVNQFVLLCCGSPRTRMHLVTSSLVFKIIPVTKCSQVGSKKLATMMANKAAIRVN